MAYNIDLTTSLKVSKQDNLSKTAGFPGSSADIANSFRDYLREASKGNSRNEMKIDDSSALRKELVNQSEPKPKIKVADNDRPAKENKEKQIDKKDKTIGEMLSKLEELANMQQVGNIPADKQIVLLENIKVIMKELFEVQTGRQLSENANLQVKVAELMNLLEGVQEELETNGILTEKAAAVDFAKELMRIVSEYTEKSETASRTAADNSTAELHKLQLISKENEYAVSQRAAEDNSSNELSVQKLNENDITTAESNMTKFAAEDQKLGMNTESPVIDTKPATKEDQPAAKESSEDLKTALDSKVEKVAVSGKEGKGQDAEARDNKEASEKVNKAISATHNKPVNEELAAIKQEQTAMDNKSEAIQNQAAAPKTQTVNKADIINQIVKKAEIIINDAQPEMRMQLEPENLGKLTLKISVEKGLITAKFVAESYEVKQTIESNFNELKDMLQEKGLVIQNLSVSVGQNSREYYNGNTFQQWKDKAKLRVRSMNAGSYNGYLEGEGTAARTINPYSIHNGEFDHKA